MIYKCQVIQSNIWNHFRVSFPASTHMYNSRCIWKPITNGISSPLACPIVLLTPAAEVEDWHQELYHIHMELPPPPAGIHMIIRFHPCQCTRQYFTTFMNYKREWRPKSHVLLQVRIFSWCLPSLLNTTSHIHISQTLSHSNIESAIHANRGLVHTLDLVNVTNLLYYIQSECKYALDIRSVLAKLVNYSLISIN